MLHRWATECMVTVFVVPVFFWYIRTCIRDHGSDLYVGIDMVKNYCLYKWYGRCSAKKGQKLSQITPNRSSTIAIHETTHENLLFFLHDDILYLVSFGNCSSSSFFSSSSFLHRSYSTNNTTPELGVCTILKLIYHK